eukprot:747104-Hanusia_phi.AAC.3
MRRNLRHIIPSHMLRCGEKGAVTDVSWLACAPTCFPAMSAGEGSEHVRGDGGLVVRRRATRDGGGGLHLKGMPGTFDIEITLSTGRPDEEWQTLEVGHIFGERAELCCPGADLRPETPANGIREIEASSRFPTGGLPARSSAAMRPSCCTTSWDWAPTSRGRR